MDKVTALRSFVMVADHNSFSLAASKLGRSKASVSKLIADLEADLGAQLLLRTTRQVRLTEAGHAYRSRCRQLLADLDNMDALVRQEETSLTGGLRVAGPATFSELYMTPPLLAFLQAHPELSIDLTLTDTLVDLVQDSYDLAIRVSTLEDSSLIARRLATTAVVCCAAPSYLRAHGMPTTPAALERHQLIIDNNFRSPSTWRFVVDGNVQHIRAHGRMQVNSATVVKQLAMAGMGVALIPEFVVLDALDDGRLQRLPLNCEVEQLGVYAVYPQRRHLAQRVRVFVDFLADWFDHGLSLPAKN